MPWCYIYKPNFCDGRTDDYVPAISNKLYLHDFQIKLKGILDILLEF